MPMTESLGSVGRSRVTESGNSSHKVPVSMTVNGRKDKSLSGADMRVGYMKHD
jgi:hypothetical protein